MFFFAISAGAGVAGPSGRHHGSAPGTSERGGRVHLATMAKAVQDGRVYIHL